MVAAGAPKPAPPKVYEAGDDRIFTLPTGRRLDRHGFYINFTHRFAFDPAFSGTARGGALLGLDGFSLSSFGFRYGVTKKLSVSIYRSPSNIGRPIEMMAAYNFLDEHDGQPLNAAVRLSIDGLNDFDRMFSENIRRSFFAQHHPPGPDLLCAHHFIQRPPAVFAWRLRDAVRFLPCRDTMPSHLGWEGQWTSGQPSRWWPTSSPQSLIGRPLGDSSSGLFLRNPEEDLAACFYLWLYQTAQGQPWHSALGRMPASSENPPPTRPAVCSRDST